MSIRIAAARATTTAPPLTLVGLALCGMVAMEFSGGFGVLDSYSPVSPFILCLALAGVVAALRLLRGPSRILWWPVLAMVGYLLAVLVSYRASHLSTPIISTGLRDVLDLVIFTIVIAVLSAYRMGWHRIALAVTVPMAAISGLAMLNEFVLHDSQSFFGFETVTTYLGVGSTTARHAGPLEDPNFWGRFLAAGLPLAYALAQRAWAAGRRRLAVIAAGSAGLLLIGIYLTSSRGAFIAAAIGTVVYLLMAGVSLLRIVGLGVLGGLLLLIPGVGSRLFTFGNENVQMAAEDQSVVARLATQRVAVAMVRDRPLFGVGPEGYTTAFSQYAAEAHQPIDRILAPHNLYLGLWAETGVLGLIGFVAVLLVGLICAAKACRAACRMPSPERALYRPYAAALFAGLLAWCVASVFLHLSYARIPLLLVCLSAGLWRQARQVQPATAHIPAPVRARTVAAGAAGAALAAVLVMLVPHGSVAAASGRVVPTDPDNSYLLSLRTRTGVIPSLAVVIDEVAPASVDAQGDVSAGLVRITAQGATAAQARKDLTGAISAGDTALRNARMTGVFRIVWDGARSTTQQGPNVTYLAVAAACGALAGLGADRIGAWGLTTWRRHGRRRGK